MKPGIPKGVRDFGPEEVRKRNYIFETIQQVFERYAYQPIETPTMENLSTLTGKYGEEGDRLLFKVLNNGDYLAKADEKALQNRDSTALTSSISKRGLRYDLTVPFARFVVMRQNELAFPFKRYQIQPVWRADRPQKGRFQEFYQCDADVVGSNSLMYEAELVEVYDQVFEQLQLPVTIKVNNRKVLFGIAEAVGVPDQFMDMTIAIDKLDKVGPEGVQNELRDRGIPVSSVELISEILTIKKLGELRSRFKDSPTGLAGIEELQTFHDYFDSRTPSNTVEFDITLARGLNYYTGCIFEVKTKGIELGSIGGGGRYDDLTGVFGLKNTSGVGISFGADRIYLALEELGLFPETVGNPLQLLLIAFDETTHRFAWTVLRKIRAAGITADLYPEPTKMKKQMKYANDRYVPWTLLIGENEMQTGKLSLKNMETGNQQALSLEEIIQELG